MIRGSWIHSVNFFAILIDDEIARKDELTGGPGAVEDGSLLAGGDATAALKLP